MPGHSNTRPASARSLIGLALLFSALLLSALLVATAVGASPKAKPSAAITIAPAPAPKIDRDGDKLFDDLEATLAGIPETGAVEVLVALTASASSERVADLSQRLGGFSTSRRFGIVDAFAATVTKSQAHALAHLPGVAHVELDSTVHALNDTAQASFGVTKARFDDPALDGDADGNPNVYSAGDLVAAVIDTGIDPTHLDLDEGKVIAFKDFVNNRTVAYDDHGHGTHVSATIAGDGDARADHLYHGIAPGAGLVGLKVLNSAGSGSFSNVVAALDWVVANRTVYGIEAVNLSLGADGCNDGTDVTSQAIASTVAAGVVVAVAAGNAGPGTCTVGTPGAAPAALTVGAMSDLGPGGFALASFSSRGKTADGRIKPDVIGPGVSVTSAAANTTNGYATWSGTSMATPFVAGVALLMREANPSLTPQQVKDAMMSTAEDWGPAGPDGDYGAGRLDAYAALRAAGAPLGATGPAVPVHSFRSGTLPGTGATADYTVNVTDTSFPIAATLTISSVTGGTSTNPDFDLFLYGPTGSQVAKSDSIYRQDALSYFPTQTGTYTVRVLSYNGTGSFFLDISAGTAVVAPTVPGAPTLVSAAPGNAQVTLGWSPPASNGGSAVTGYKLYRGLTSGGETLLATLPNVSTYIDNAVVNGTTYYYRVSAVNGIGEGVQSNGLSATPVLPPAETTPPSKPTNLKALVAGTNQVALDWSASTDNVGVTRYEVLRGGTVVATVTDTHYLDSGLAAGTTYPYQVRALDAAGNQSPLSSNVNGRTVSSSTSSTGILSGVVYDTSGKPLSNVVVTYTLNGVVKTVKANSSGVWKLSNLPPGSYTLTFSLSGHPSQPLVLDAVAGKTVLATLTLS